MTTEAEEKHGMNLLAGEIADLRGQVRSLKTQLYTALEGLKKIKDLADELNTLEGLGIVGMKQVSEMAAIAMSNEENEQH